MRAFGICTMYVMLTQMLDEGIATVLCPEIQAGGGGEVGEEGEVGERGESGMV